MREIQNYNISDSNKTKKQKYQTVGTIPKSNIKIVDQDKIDTPNAALKVLSTRV
jgi:hypothetical protein